MTLTYFFPRKNPKELKKIINKEIKTLFEWLCAYRLSLNLGKTEFIIFWPPKMSLKDRFGLKINSRITRRTLITQMTKGGGGLLQSNILEKKRE